MYWMLSGVRLGAIFFQMVRFESMLHGFVAAGNVVISGTTSAD